MIRNISTKKMGNNMKLSNKEQRKRPYGRKNINKRVWSELEQYHGNGRLLGIKVVIHSPLLSTHLSE